MEPLQDPVVASLGERSPHPYSSIAMSPNRKLAIVAGKDTLQLVKVGLDGLSAIRSMRISQHFQTAPVTADGRTQIRGNFNEQDQGRVSFVRDTFGMAAKPSPTPRSSMTNVNVNVVLTDVAWSSSHRFDSRSTGEDYLDNNTKDESSMPPVSSSSTANYQSAEGGGNDDDNDSIIAAAGSNGVVVVWSARRAFFQEHESSSSMADQQPEAILSQHSRAVNRLAWHPRKPGLLLTASQDSKVKLWVRRVSTTQSQPNVEVPGYLSWFGRLGVTPPTDRRSYSWQCRNTFEPKSEAVRDVRWSPFHNDIFAIVTVSGSLIVYNMYVKERSLVKVSAHAGDATTLDWHPTRPGIIATGGAGDRCVKVWNLESLFNMGNDESYMLNNSNTVSSNGSNETDPSGYASSTIGSTSGALKTVQNASRSVTMMHILSVSATVTRLRWRPPCMEGIPSEEDGTVADRHESMLAVATAPIKGASAGGSGVLSLWSYHRPYMPLSVLEGHKEGAVTDFYFLDTPQSESQLRHFSSLPHNFDSRSLSHNKTGSDVVDRSPHSLKPAHDLGNIHYDNVDSEDRDQSSSSPVRIWQHVLSVGRDGRCLLQSFPRGDRPIARVPPSCFSMANYSPFQKGSGSLQIFSVHQKIPSGPKDDFFLTGLRQDAITARAPGVFREVPAIEEQSDLDWRDSGSWAAGKRLPEHVPELVFNVLDKGELDQDGIPIEGPQEGVMLAPEVVHLSRFARLYKLYPDEDCPTRVELCLHNGNVAESVKCGSLARMWVSVASMLHGSGLDALPQEGSLPCNVMQFILLPTLKSLLEERANGGDVQTCVALCEVLQVILPDEKTRIPELDFTLVREWYLAYIDLLRDMCLFSYAASLIRSCKDPFIGALNQQSTTFNESCPSCGKPLQPSESSSSEGMASNLGVIARRACKTCRRRVGFCFICHEPVKGMFVWCPGCGHGGHLDHALQWFGGLSGQPIRETCPTGCGHRCNFSQPLSAFPRTCSFRQMP